MSVCLLLACVADRLLRPAGGRTGFLQSSQVCGQKSGHFIESQWKLISEGAVVFTFLPTYKIHIYLNVDLKFYQEPDKSKIYFIYE